MCPRSVHPLYFFAVGGQSLASEIYTRLDALIFHHGNQRAVVWVVVLMDGHHLASMQVCALLEEEEVGHHFDTHLGEDSDFRCVDDTHRSPRQKAQNRDCHFHWALPSHLLDPCRRCHLLALEEVRPFGL